MKKIIISIFFLLACFSHLTALSAQNVRDIKVYIPPVTGEGRSGDSNFFYQQLTYEVIFQHHTLVRSQRGSDYTLRGMITPQTGTRDFVFYLEMIESSNDEVIAQQNITYSSIDTSISSLLSAMVYNMLSVIPNINSPDDWRNNYLFIDGYFFWAPRLYISRAQSINWMNPGLGFSAEYHFLDFMAVGLGFQFSQDWILVNTGNEYRDLLLEIPVSIRFIFNPANFMVVPYAGLTFNISIQQETIPSPLSAVIGCQFGIKAGPGQIVIDPRVSLDLLNSSVGTLLYNRYTIQIGAGYKYGFIPKRGARGY